MIKPELNQSRVNFTYILRMRVTLIWQGAKLEAGLSILQLLLHTERVCRWCCCSSFKYLGPNLKIDCAELVTPSSILYLDLGSLLKWLIIIRTWRETKKHTFLFSFFIAIAFFFCYSICHLRYQILDNEPIQLFN